MAETGKGTGENCEDNSTEQVTFDLDLGEWVREDIPCRGTVPAGHRVLEFLGTKGNRL